MAGVNRVLPDRFGDPVLQLLILIAAASLMGGGGISFGLANLAVQLAAIALLAANPGAVRWFVKGAPRTLVALVAATILFPLLQLVPLPASVWQALPGRDLAASALGAAGELGWFPYSLDSSRTLLSLIGLIVPFTALVLAWRLDRPALYRIPDAIVAAALAGFALGVVQVFSNHEIGLLYDDTDMPGVLFGLFANRNTTALAFDVALIMLAALPPQRPLSPPWLAKAGVALLLGAGVIMTQSRSGMGLLAVPVLFALVRSAALYWRRRKGPGAAPTARAAPLVAGIAALCLAAAVSVPLIGSSRIGMGVERFAGGETVRPQIWEDGLYAAQRYWPAGAGMGTFDEVFQIDESLEYVSPKRAARAHNDYLELGIEAGVAGFAILAGWFLWIAGAASVARRIGDPWPAWGAAASLAAIAVQSAVDYPLRNQAMLCTAALLVAMLLRAGWPRRGTP